MTVSVVIPSYNYGRFIAQAVQSVLAQTFKDVEIIVVDDNSSDDTPSVLGQFSDSIIYLRQPVNRGPNAARNAGIRASRGEFIGLLDADDYWLPQKLERQLPLFESRSEVGLVYANISVCIGENGKEVWLGHNRESTFKRGRVLRELYMVQFIPSPTPVIRRRVFDEVGYFDETAKAADDYDMWLRIANRYEFDFVPELLAVYRLHPSVMSSRRDDYDGEMLAFLDRFAREHPADLGSLRRERLSRFKTERGWRQVRLGSHVRGIRYLWNAIRDAPWRIEPYMLLFLSLICPRGSEERWRKAVAQYFVGRQDLIGGEFRSARHEFWKSIRTDFLAMPKAVPALLLALVGSRRLVKKVYRRTIGLASAAGDQRLDENMFRVRLV